MRRSIARFATLCQRDRVYGRDKFLFLLHTIRSIFGQSRFLGGSAVSDANVTMERLDDQINWYDRRSMNDQQYFKRMKAIVILAAALIPFLSGNPFPYSQWVVGGLGVLIVVIEGLQQLYQFQANWLNY